MGTATTSSAGLSSLSYVAPAGFVIGSNHALSASFAGDGGDTASSGVGTLTVTQYVSTLSVAALTGTPSQIVTMSATLTKSGGSGVSGETISFSVDGTAVGMAVTNSGGIATLPYAIAGGATTGSHTGTVTVAGDANYLSSTGTGPLTVKYVTTLTAAPVSGAWGTSVPLTATLTVH